MEGCSVVSEGAIASYQETMPDHSCAIRPNTRLPISQCAENRDY